MRVIFSSANDFVDELTKSDVYNNVVRLWVSQEYEQEEQATWHFEMHLTAILIQGEKEVLVEFSCQFDNDEEAKAVDEGVREACKLHGYEVRPGRIEMY